MAALGEQVWFNTVSGPCVAFVVGLDPESGNPDDDTELFVIPGREQRNDATGLSGPDYRPSHADGQAGGYTVR